MFGVAYRWRVPPDREQQFVEAWTELTKIIRDEHGGLGSRLHRGSDGTWFAYAQWPSEDDWKRPKAVSERMLALRKTLSDASEELFPEWAGAVCVDLLVRRGWNSDAEG